jgi:hypothetical protein
VYLDHLAELTVIAHLKSAILQEDVFKNKDLIYV